MARALASSAEGLTLDEMCQLTGCERRTVERMRDTIREVFPQMEEIPDHPTKRFHIPKGLDGFFQDPTTEELSDLGVVVAELRESGAAARAASLAELDKKIRAAMRHGRRRATETDVEALLRAERIAVQAGPRPTEDPAVLMMLRQALAGHRRLLRFIYHGGSKPGASRDVVPYGIIFGRMNYLIGADAGTTKPKHWRLDRIEQLECLDTAASPPADFDLVAFANTAFAYFEGQQEDVVLACPSGRHGGLQELPLPFEPDRRRASRGRRHRALSRERHARIGVAPLHLGQQDRNRRTGFLAPADDHRIARRARASRRAVAFRLRPRRQESILAGGLRPILSQPTLILLRAMHPLSASRLNDFLGCPHQAALWLAGIKPAREADATLELIRDKGFEHEAAVLARLEKLHGPAERIPSDGSLADRARLTREAIERGATLIYQGALTKEAWLGYPDFLLRTGAARRGALTPEDAKLSRKAKGEYLLQLGIYAELLEALFGIPVQSGTIHVAAGDPETLRSPPHPLHSQAAHARLRALRCRSSARDQTSALRGVRAMRLQAPLRGRVAQGRQSVLRRGSQRRAGRETGGGRRSHAFAGGGAFARHENRRHGRGDASPSCRPKPGSSSTPAKSGKHGFELLPRSRGRGFAMLPAPDDGDLFFDMEGDPLAGEGLEYLFGIFGRLTGEPKTPSSGRSGRTARRRKRRRSRARCASLSIRSAGIPARTSITMPPTSRRR